MSASWTQALAAVTASEVLSTISGCLRRKALYHPSPGILSANGVFLLVSSIKPFTLTFTSSFLCGKPFCALTHIHLTRRFSSSVVNIVGGPKPGFLKSSLRR
uniref:Uncharacterized protein n=1 Tax=Cacopsylla melanoneura TaxID=428564 RepID=A0A8D8R7A4_9HEMI